MNLLGEKWIVADPMALAAVCWPEVNFYDKQRETVWSVERNVETYVPAGNKLGKDFVAAYIAINWFVRNDPARVFTTSVKDEHLIVLWSEISRFLQTSAVPLLVEQGGFLEFTHHRLRKMLPNGSVDDFSYVLGAVSKSQEGKSGHHTPNGKSLIIGDESSGLSNDVYQAAQGWANRFLFFGNPNPCQNWWRTAIREGNVRLAA